MNMRPKKSLGQHWLRDAASLRAIADAAEITDQDTVLEIGPGLGTLTKELLKQAKQVIAIEFDDTLALTLESQMHDAKLHVVQGDIRTFDLTQLPPDYIVVANIPYYLTSHLLRLLGESSNPPIRAALLMQQEVAERVCAQPGEMSMLSVSVQYYYQAYLGQIVPAALFDPPPKVDSQVLILHRRPEPMFGAIDTRQYFRIIKAGFAGKRKKLRSSLSAGLQITKEQADTLLTAANISGDLRAQNLALEDWHALYTAFAA